MDEAIRSKNKKISIFELSSLKKLKNLKLDKNPFACLVVSLKEVNKDEKLSVANEVIEKGCRYVVCSEIDCRNWEDAFDNAFLEKFDYNLPSKYSFSTTSHQDESVEDIVNYLFFNTVYGPDNKPFTDYLVLFVGKDERKKEIYQKEIKKYVGQKNAK